MKLDEADGEGGCVKRRYATQHSTSSKYPALKRRATIITSLRDAAFNIIEIPGVERRATIITSLRDAAFNIIEIPGVETPGYHHHVAM